MSGVLPIIFASSIVSLPELIARFFPTPASGTIGAFFLSAISSTSWLYAIIYFLLIIFFNYFYVSIQFNPIEVANNLKKNGGFVPGLRPGKPTADFITKVLSKIIIIGAIFLGLIAVLPIFFSGALNLNLYFGGTSLLIIVGVALETVKQMESQMLMRHYKGFLE
jgi:preprotein translocase subunit SecY